MKKTDSHDWKAWLIKAREDELSLRAVLKEGAQSTACFLAQQMAEKLLKALLLYHDQEFPKVHDLLELASRLLKIEPRIRNLVTELTKLNRYYIETRYPGDYPEFTKREGKEAYEMAMRIKNFVMRRIEV